MNTNRCLYALHTRAQYYILRQRIVTLSAVKCKHNSRCNSSRGFHCSSSSSHSSPILDLPTCRTALAPSRLRPLPHPSVNDSSSRRRCFASKPKPENNPTNETSGEALNTQRQTRESRPWEEYYQSLVRFQKENGHTNVPEEYKRDPWLLWFVRRQKQLQKELTEEQTNKLNSIDFDWQTHVERMDNQWQEMFDRLLEYRREYGDYSVPQKYDIDPSLGRWVDKQRYNQTTGRMADHRYQQLDELGFTWTKMAMGAGDTSTHDKKWKRQYDKLKVFFMANGHCVIPTKFDKDPPLGNWVAAQRGLYRKGLLREDRREQLDVLEFVFSFDTTTPEEHVLHRQWEENFEYLLEYKERHGNVKVPNTYEAHELGQWVGTQRRRDKAGRLELTRKDRLLKIGFQFAKVRDESWQENYEKLKHYQEKHGHCLLPRNDEDQVLANWVLTQRAYYRDGKLPKERQTKLEALGFVWTTRKRSTKANTTSDVYLIG